MRMFVSRNSGTGIKIRPFPSAFPDFELQPVETVFEGFALPSSAAGLRVLLCELLQVLTDQPGQSIVALDCDLPHLPDKLVIQ